jgi:hypothetical protein
MGSRIIRAVLVAAAAAGIAVAAAPTASAAPAGHHPRHARVIRPDFSCSSCNIIEGTGYGLGAPDPSPGHPVTQETVGRTVTWVHQTTYLGYDAGYWKLNVNGDYVSMNAGCNGATVKSDPASSGTVWFMVDAGGGKWYVGSRYCDNQQQGNIVLEGDGVLHHQYAVAAIGACCGIWEKMFIG